MLQPSVHKRDIGIEGGWSWRGIEKGIGAGRPRSHFNPRFIRRFFRSAIRSATKSTSSSILEMHISSACWHRPFVRHGQCAMLVGLQGNFLCQHDVACDQIAFRHKAPTNTWKAGAVEFVDVHRGAVANAVSLSAMAAGDLKTALRVILRELLRR
jgi:hypothetical protein